MKQRNLLSTRRRRDEAFTLVEIMVVVVIIGLLAGLVGPKIFKRVEDARVKITKEQMREFGVALDMFRLDFGSYPNSLEGLLTEEQNGPYLKSVPNDPWGQPYGYQVAGNGEDYVITSSGGGKAEIRSDV